MTFAGFWVDGAVRKPEARHFDKENLVIARWKDELSLDLLLKGFSDWHGVYWLDTTPRESLTPEELFSVLKVIWPQLECVMNALDDSWRFGRGVSIETPIDWGNLTQYPPPTEPQWIRITRENVRQYLFRLCRCRDSESESWQDGHIVGWDIEDECCLVDGDFNPVERVMKFDFVEVQNAPTP